MTCPARLRRPLSRPAPLVLEVDLGRGLLSTPPADPLSALRTRNTPRLEEILGGLLRALDDDAVAGAVVLLGGHRVAPAQAEELGAALGDLAASGRPVVAWAESFGELGPGTAQYYLATHASSVWMQPSGAVGLTGVALDVVTVRELLDRFGAEPQLGQHQEYKSAAETFVAREISAPNREMTQRIADSVLERVCDATIAGRNMRAEDVAEAVGSAPVPAARALELGLVDRLGYRPTLYQQVRDDLGRDGEIRLQYAQRYAHHRARTVREQVRTRRQASVGVVRVDGTITVGRSTAGSPLTGPTAGSDSVGAALRSAAEDDGIGAVVLRVDSPGGSYVASDAVRSAILELRETGRPVVASMAGVAASGGYFVSMPCDEILASPSTLTGSIGVLGGKVVLADAAARAGVTRESIGAGDHATMFSSARPFDAEEWARLDAWLDAVYADFTEKAAQDRRMPVETLEPLARGRVWTGADARERGLVDRLGGLETAVAAACARAGLDRERVRVRPVPHVPLLARLQPAESSDSPVGAAAATDLLTTVTRALGVPSDGVLALPWRTRWVV